MREEAWPGLVIEKNAATIVFEECRGVDAGRVAHDVIESLAHEVGRFTVRITPGMRDKIAEVRISKESGEWRSFEFVGDGVSDAGPQRAIPVRSGKGAATSRRTL